MKLNLKNHMTKSKQKSKLRAPSINYVGFANNDSNFSSSSEDSDSSEDAKSQKKKKPKSTSTTVTLNQLKQIQEIVKKKREENSTELFLHEVLRLKLPKNEVAERNPVLEARCQKLKAEQEQKEYRNMTKNVDSFRKHIPETDTIAYQSE